MESEAQLEIKQLVGLLKPEDRGLLRAMPKSDLGKLHMSYGMWLRNQFRSNAFPNLFRFCSARIHQRSFDAISEVVIGKIWLHIQANSAGG
jgi:hypothetical protein